MAESIEVYLLPLKNDGSPDVPGEYIFLPPPSDPPYILRFVIEGSSPICRKGSLWLNIPSPGKPFESDKFREFSLLPKLSDSAAPSPHVHTRTETHYVDVAPDVRLNGNKMPIEALSIFSVVSKFMGKYPTDWNKHFQGISNRGYNVVHFTPLMTMGESNSPYSIYNQLEFDKAVFPNGDKDVVEMATRLEKEYSILALTDVVWNHTANNSKWLQEHPEAGYNVETAPWLEAALELDDALLQYGRDLHSLGLPTEFKTVDDLVTVMQQMKPHVIEKIRLWEFYAIDVQHDRKAILEAWKSAHIEYPAGGFGDIGIGGLDRIRQWSLDEGASFLRAKGLENDNQLLGRHSRKVNARVGAALVTALYGRYDEKTADIQGVEEHIIKILDALNLPLLLEYDKDVLGIFDQLFNRIKYLRLDEHGPKLGPVTEQSPLIETYFTRLPLNETKKNQDPKCLSVVNNGWVWNADALRDNAGPHSRAYLRREVIVWGDCVKLRYGKSPEDSPFLWDYMTRYTELMAKHFSGFRIDNCHSTPLHVAEYLLHKARRVRPNLMVYAELFTGSEETDYLFTKRLGLTALIREAMQAWSGAELSRLVHRHGGRPIGSFDPSLLSNWSQMDDKTVLHHIRPSTVHALFMDCTHDNEMPAQKRDPRDTLPNAALVAMCASAIGSVMGYDEIYPAHVNLVSDTRSYTSAFSEGDLQGITGTGGIGGIKKLLNRLHTEMAIDEFDETHIHHVGEYITVHRVHPHTRKGTLLVSRTAFAGSGAEHVLAPIYLTGTKATIFGAWKLEVDGDRETKALVTSDQKYLRGLPSRVSEISGFRLEEKGDDTVIYTPSDFPPGSIALLETHIHEENLPEGLSGFITSDVDEAFRPVDLTGLNFVLYRCEAEERDSSHGKDGVYNVPNFGPLVYAGLQGWWSILEDIIRNNNIGHPLCDNIREGQWALDFIVRRMRRAISEQGYTQLESPTKWLEDRFDAIRRVPNFLLPRYFTIIIKAAYDGAYRRAIHELSYIIRHGQQFIHEMGLISVQQLGEVTSASLYPTKQVPCLAAGLPHFATDWARCWGRDMFISLRGLLLTTGRLNEAKEHILAFASVLKHGMIPNLLSSGKFPRYNSRDSVWFFLQAIQDYTHVVPNGIQILDEKVPRRFLPYDDTWFPFDDERAYSQSSTVAEIIQEIFQRHASGISFREHNAGPELDMQMKPEGFQVDIHVDWETGFVFGGNQWNCGTWMDKMGESVKAGNKGYPGTPRDGAPVEITGMLYSALRWVSGLRKAGHYQHDGVDIGSDRTITFQQWAERVKANFEKCYYVPVDAADDNEFDVDSNLVNRRGIYKDVYKSGKPYEDYQLRPNFPIAMTVAPDLFDPARGLHALIIVDVVLRAPLGMATLDPTDLNYRPYYNNSEDSTDFATAKGRNYHQGPEWLWPAGYFYRALLKFTLLRDSSYQSLMDVYQQITMRLEGCLRSLRQSPWRGLTELTNKNGEFCSCSSPTQAWSAACLLDLYYDASEIQKERTSRLHV
ncbi:bifunctional 4-alpha-glucanotransferase/amylo-alpha-1,6-glucosidase [Emydomyces testavorans]|uniref:Glycogen debranching enzyme n=1 Tax=Emydomyces testavorans TaxID=2070801 RepID=A0AAF0DMM8_9EURO|nr:bifunctional 4-alpha-glucanotransferase/amylo-alpha-1,6-glucosidase [Emydomyces testavorans]